MKAFASFTTILSDGLRVLVRRCRYCGCFLYGRNSAPCTGCNNGLIDQCLECHSALCKTPPPFTGFNFGGSTP